MVAECVPDSGIDVGLLSQGRWLLLAAVPFVCRQKSERKNHTDNVKFVVGGRSSVVRDPVDLLVSIAKGLECWYHYNIIGPHHRTVDASLESRGVFGRLAEETTKVWIGDTDILVAPGCLALGYAR